MGIFVTLAIIGAVGERYEGFRGRGVPVVVGSFVSFDFLLHVFCVRWGWVGGCWEMLGTSQVDVDDGIQLITGWW